MAFSVPTGKAAPKWSTEALMPDGSFKTLSSADFAGKYFVVLFYPLDFTFVCPTEIIAFSDAADKFKALDCEVVTCSVDSQFVHLAWTQVTRNKGGLGKMNIPMLADIGGQIATDFGVLKDSPKIANRGLFIIDGQGVVRSCIVNDLPVGRSVDEALRLVKAFQFTDKHGEVCPANWDSGKPTMKADPVGSQDYFKTVQ